MTVKKEQLVKITREFVAKLDNLLAVKSQSEELGNFSSSTFYAWRRGTRDGACTAKISTVLRIINSPLFNGVCEPEATGLPPESCEILQRCLGKYPVKVAEHKPQYESVSLESLISSKKAYELAIGATRLWVDRLISSDRFVVGVDYSLAHIDRVLQNLNQLIHPFTAKGLINEDDAFLLVMTALLHDLGYFYPSPIGQRDVSLATLGRHSHSFANQIEEFSESLPAGLKNCIEQLLSNDRGAAMEVETLIQGYSQHLAVFVRFHNASQMFPVGDALENTRSNWNVKPDKALALLAIFQLADSLDFHYERADLMLREKLSSRDFDDLSPLEKRALTRLSMHTAFGIPTVKCSAREIEIFVHPRIGGPRAIGNSFLKLCNAKVDNCVNKDKNPMLTHLEKYLPVNISVTSELEEGSNFEMSDTLAFAMAKNIESDETPSVSMVRSDVACVSSYMEDAFAEMLNFSGGHITWVKKYHPRGFLYGGKCFAHTDLRRSVPVIERQSFDPDAWCSRDESQSVFAVTDPFSFFKNAGISPHLFRYYLIATTDIESEVYVLLRSSYENRPLLCLNLHFCKSLSEFELLDWGNSLADRYAPYAETYEKARRSQIYDAIKIADESDQFGSELDVAGLLSDFANWVKSGEFFDFAELIDQKNLGIRRVDESSRQSKPIKRSTIGFVADRHWFQGWVSRVVEITRRHGVFNFSCGVCRDFPSVHFTVRIPKARKLPPGLIRGLSTFTDLFKRLETILVRQDFSLEEFAACLDLSRGAWRELLLLAYEGRMLSELSGGTIRLVGEHSVFQEDLGFRLEFPCIESFAEPV